MQTIRHKLATTVAACVLAASATPVQASIVFSFEAAGVQATTVAGAVTENFNSIAAGTYASYVSPTIGGTYTPLRVSAPNVFGGAGNSMFANLNGNPLVTTLTFTAAKTYFGMWWSAGDATDKLEFFDGATLVGTFNVGSLIPYLTPAYYGNPNGGPFVNEPFAYVNFTGVSGTTFDRVRFTETDGGGFETDNHSVYDQEITPPGTVVPEPSTYLAGALLALVFGVQGFRSLRSRKQTA